MAGKFCTDKIFALMMISWENISFSMKIDSERETLSDYAIFSVILLYAWVGDPTIHVCGEL